MTADGLPHQHECHLISFPLNPSSGNGFRARLVWRLRLIARLEPDVLYHWARTVQEGGTATQLLWLLHMALMREAIEVEPRPNCSGYFTWL